MLGPRATVKLHDLLHGLEMKEKSETKSGEERVRERERVN